MEESLVLIKSIVRVQMLLESLLTLFNNHGSLPGFENVPVLCYFADHVTRWTANSRILCANKGEPASWFQIKFMRQKNPFSTFLSLKETKNRRAFEQMPIPKRWIVLQTPSIASVISKRLFQNFEKQKCNNALVPIQIWPIPPYFRVWAMQLWSQIGE